MGAVDRRRFLSGLGRGLAGLALSSGLPAGFARAFGPIPPTPIGTLAASVMSGPLPPVEILHAPIVLRRGEVLENRRFLLSPAFVWSSVLAAVYTDATDVTIRNVHLVGGSSWQARWNAYNEPTSAGPGIASGTCGIRLQGAARARVETVTIEGFPSSGIEGFGLDDAVIRDVHVARCFQGLKTDHSLRNPRVTIEWVHVRDLWGPAPGLWPGITSAPSLLRPGGYTGANGFSLHSLRDSVVRNCTVLGEQSGSFKLVNSQRTELSGLQGVTFMIQGTSDLGWSIDPEPSIDTCLHSSYFDKALSQAGSHKSKNCIQASWHVQGLRIENCSLHGGSQNGHAIQFALDVHGEVRGTDIHAFNGQAGSGPAYALDLVDSSSVNPDFLAANRFQDQQHYILQH